MTSIRLKIALCMAALTGFAAGCKQQPPTIEATASFETRPIAHGGDAADDVAIWVHPRDPAASTVIATDKRGGLAVYDLQGREIQSLPDGPANNVDLRDGFLLGDRRVCLVAASRPDAGEIAFYRVDPRTRQLVAIGVAVLDDFAPKGLCLYQSRVSGHTYVFAGNRDGAMRQYEILSRGGQVDLREVRRMSFDSDIEGCVASDSHGRLYVAQEDVAIWSLDAEPSGSTELTMVDAVGLGRLQPDIEGLSLVRTPDGELLVASCQALDEFVVYRSDAPFTCVGTFRVISGNGIDAVTHSDGIEISAAPLGDDFPGGLLVVQDDHNDYGHQNFKLVRWDQIESQLDRTQLARGNRMVTNR